MHTTVKINQDIEARVHSLVTSLADLNPINTIIINVNNSPLFSKIVITSGSSTKHVEYISHHLHKSIIDLGLPAPRVEGNDNSEWVIFDLNEIIFHIMIPEVRAFYKLEEIWGKGSSNILSGLHDKNLDFINNKAKNNSNNNDLKNLNLFSIDEESMSNGLLFLRFWTYIFIPAIISGILYILNNKPGAEVDVPGLIIITITLSITSYGLHKLNKIAWYFDWVLLLSMAGFFNKLLIEWTLGWALGTVFTIILIGLKINSKQHFLKH